MSGMNPEAAVYVGVKMICRHLADNELAALNLAVTAGWSNLAGVEGYEKAKSLFTEENETKMHSHTLAAFQAVVNERLTP